MYKSTTRSSGSLDVIPEGHTGAFSLSFSPLWSSTPRRGGIPCFRWLRISVYELCTNDELTSPWFFFGLCRALIRNYSELRIESDVDFRDAVRGCWMRNLRYCSHTLDECGQVKTTLGIDRAWNLALRGQAIRLAGIAKPVFVLKGGMGKKQRRETAAAWPRSWRKNRHTVRPQIAGQESLPGTGTSKQFRTIAIKQ